MRDCERYLNDPNVTSDSLKDGIRDLMSKSEENFGKVPKSDLSSPTSKNFFF